MASFIGLEFGHQCSNVPVMSHLCPYELHMKVHPTLNAHTVMSVTFDLIKSTKMTQNFDKYSKVTLRRGKMTQNLIKNTRKVEQLDKTLGEKAKKLIFRTCSERG